MIFKNLVFLKIQIVFLFCSDGIFFLNKVGSHIFNESRQRLYVKHQSLHYLQVFIKENNSSYILTPFWKSTGLCPPDPHENSYKFLLSSDMEQNFFHIGTLPGNGTTQVRIHWMMDLIKLRILPKFKVMYNFNHLDELIYMLWKNNLQPGFELMGNPSNYFTDFENVTQIYLWKDIIQTMAKRYIDMFGIEYVLKWNFETWNEPDHHDFDNLNFTIQGFLNYYDACSEGLKAAHERLKFGGPGGSCRIPSVGHSPLCWALLSHCSGGKNFFTGEVGVRIDFISFHKKGNGTTFVMFDEEIETIKFIRKKYPVLSHVPFYNDEADPLKNWSLSQWWRADTTYAAMVVKIIVNHVQLFMLETSEILKNVHFNLLSSDNAFLSYVPNQFTQRTLLSRFQVNNTSPNYVEFVKKPVYSSFILLSKLCPHILTAEVYNNGRKIDFRKSNFGILATSCKSEKEINMILYNTVDSQTNGSDATVYISLNISLMKGFRWIILELDNINTNPYLIWKNLGMPTFPTLKQFSLMKIREEPLISGPFSSYNNVSLKLNLKIMNPGITLISICNEQRPLLQVTKIQFLQIWNFTLQLSWTDMYNRCVFTYNIEKSSKKFGPYHQLNKKNISSLSYWYSCFDYDLNCTLKGFYRIYPIDYWGTRGPYSESFLF